MKKLLARLFAVDMPRMSIDYLIVAIVITVAMIGVVGTIGLF
jgi:hypothetical protein